MVLYLFCMKSMRITVERKDKPTNPIILQFLTRSSLTQKQHEKSKLQARAADARVVQHTRVPVSSRVTNYIV